MAGALGPTNRTLSLAVDVNDPGKRTHDFDQFVAAYTEQIRGLLDGGVDFLLFETVFDTLVLKAALFAAMRHFEGAGRSVPLMVSVTITDKSRPDALGPDGRGVLELRLARAAPLGRNQLRARREGDAALRRGAVAASRRSS